MSEPQKGPTTRPSLLVRLQSPDDQEAQTEFHNLYQPMILRLLRSKLQFADADNVFQELLVKLLYDKLTKFRYDASRGKFRGWLARVTSNELNDFLRKHNREFPQLDDDLLNETVREIEGEVQKAENVLWADAKNRVQNRIKPDTWECFRLRVEEGLSPEDVAEKMGISRNKVDFTKCRVVKMLEQEVERLRSEKPCAELDEAN